MISRRSVILSAGAFCLSFAGLPAAQAADPRFLEDLLHGVSDALIRDYIRKHYDKGKFDGKRWQKDGKRYSPIEYRNHLIEQYRRDDFDRRAPKRPEPQHRPPQSSKHNPTQPPRHNAAPQPRHDNRRPEPPKKQPQRKPGPPMNNHRPPRHDDRRPPMPR